MPNTKSKAKPAVKKAAVPSKKKAVAKKPVARKAAPVVKSAAVSVGARVTFAQAIRSYFQNYFNFNGVATRAQYWWVALLMILACLGGLGLSGMFFVAGINLIGSILFVAWVLFMLATIVPSIAIMSRRIHDAGFSAWVYFVPVIIVWVLELFPIPGIGIISFAVSVLGLVLALLPSKLQNNPYRN